MTCLSRILPIGWMQLYVLIQWASCERNFLSCFDQCTHYGLHSLWEKFSLLRYRATAYSMMKLHEYSKVTTLFLRVIVRATETSSWPKTNNYLNSIEYDIYIIYRGGGTSFFLVKHEKFPLSYIQDAKNFSVVKPLNSGEAVASPASPVPRPLSLKDPL